MLSRDMIAFHYHVPFKRLNEPAICAALHRFCTGRDMDYNRWEQLARMRVTADKETWLARMDVSTRGKIAEVLA